MTDLKYLEQLETIVKNTSDQVLDHYFMQTTAELKMDGSIVTEADLTMQQQLTRELELLSPDIQMLGEEMTPPQQQDIINGEQPYWCLDPLDGTNNFHHGVPLYAVSIGLVIDKTIQLGIVYDPVRKELFSALKGHGFRVNGKLHQKLDQPQDLKFCLASIDFKRLDTTMKARLIQQMPFKSQRNIGTCALEWAWLACGRTQLLLHGGEKLWDYAAGSILLSEADGCSCSNRTDPVFNNDLSNRPVIAASNQVLHRLWLSFLFEGDL
jgi:myo-inositol-1(or 4)-monophosphatase